ncbi:MAG: hypothetical protein DRJ32_04220 [Thermoprotei archaeon]|nr:MAG: hypothetical protein DRJ32_04220 [Thermoprotei archaeon]
MFRAEPKGIALGILSFIINIVLFIYLPQYILSLVKARYPDIIVDLDVSTLSIIGFIIAILSLIRYVSEKPLSIVVKFLGRFSLVIYLVYVFSMSGFGLIHVEYKEAVLTLNISKLLLIIVALLSLSIVLGTLADVIDYREERKKENKS